MVKKAKKITGYFTLKTLLWKLKTTQSAVTRALFALIIQIRQKQI